VASAGVRGWPIALLVLSAQERAYLERHLSGAGRSYGVRTANQELTRKQIQRGVHTSVRQLEADIRTFIDLHNKNPKPFKWTKSADQILASVERFCHKAQQTLCGEIHVPRVWTHKSCFAPLNLCQSPTDWPMYSSEAARLISACPQARHDKRTSPEVRVWP
jgi:hypothetical protein